MPETFLLLLSGGVMLAAGVPRSRLVSILWLRLAGILGLCFAALGAFFAAKRGTAGPVAWMLIAGLALLILAQLALVQTVRLNAQRIAAVAAYLLAVACGVVLLSDSPELWATLASAGIAAMTGLVLMDMLLGHAYLTAAKMTIAPFRQLHLALAAAVALRIIIGAVAIGAQMIHPVEQFWNRFGLYLGTRWFVGLIVPAFFVYMAHDCIRRRSTQSATGILYVTAVLIFIGELMALYLTRETGLPF